MKALPTSSSESNSEEEINLIDLHNDLNNEAADANSERLTSDSETDDSNSSVFNRHSVLIHPPSCEDRAHFEEQDPGVSRQRLQGQNIPGRPVERNQAMLPPRPTRDIPGRLVTQGDIISYFTGFVDEFDEEIWLTAVVNRMFLTQQRLFPT